MATWPLRRMDELCEITSSKRIYAADYVSQGVPFYRGREITEKYKGDLDVSTELFITEEKFCEIERKFGVPKEGDLLLTSVGTLGSVYVVKPGDRFYFKDGNLTWFRHFNGLDSRFLYYWIGSSQGKVELQKCTIGSSQSAFTIVLLKSMEIELPPLPIQRRIASILSVYDELIENSQRRIRILDAMARALYHEWFVYFRFPGHEDHPRVASPLGEIPQGWEVTSFKEAAVFENGDRGKNYPSVSEFLDDGVPFINAGHLVDGAVDSTRVNRISEVKFEQLHSGKICEGDILYCLRGSPGRTARTAGISRGAIASSLVIVRPTVRANREFLYYTLSGKRGSRMVSELENGVAQPNISVSSVQKYPLLLPSKDVLNKFAQFIEPNWRLIDALRAQLSVLKAYRDVLLPRLLAGQVDVEVA